MVDRVGESRMTYVLMNVGGTLYCVDVACVHGVVEVDSVTQVPGAPRQIRGVMNVGGRVLPLGDLAVALGAPPTTNGGRTTAVLLDTNGTDGPAFAMLGDVMDVLELGEDRIEPPPSFGLGAAAPLVTGIVHLAEGNLALVLDPERLLESMGVIGAAG
jgi:purine-binding chemotaxis protein CheW